MSKTVTLRSGGAVAEVAALGAELRAWSVAEQPLIWTSDPAIWDATAPILFPVVGWTRGGSVRVGDDTYSLGLHGFARTAAFRIAEQAADRVRFVLESSWDTRAVYPFDFELAVAYHLGPTTLRTELCIRNTGEGPMPYACGLHPGFCWPFAGGDTREYTVEFAGEELAAVPVISPDGLFTRERRPVPLEGRHLLLSDALFAREALCFLEARSTSVRFTHQDGAAITLALDDFPHIALWSRPGGGFLSIEAWTGHGDCIDSDGNLWTKPSMIHLAAGAKRRHAATYAFTFR
jgi:galactose mutarotase-like enzyme